MTSLSYDASGNLTDDGERVMEYDALNRLSVVRRKDTAVTIAGEPETGDEPRPAHAAEVAPDSRAPPKPGQGAI